MYTDTHRHVHTQVNTHAQVHTHKDTYTQTYTHTWWEEGTVCLTGADFMRS